MEGGGSLKFPEGCKCTSGIAEYYSYHEPINVETAQLSYSEIKVTPQNGMGSDPFEFHIETVNGSFLCLHNMYLYFRGRVVRQDGSPIGSGEEVSLINNPLMSMWRSIETKLGNSTVNPSSSYHIPYKAMLPTLLSYDPNKNSGTLSTSLFIMDEPGLYDVLSDENDGYHERRQRIANSAEFDLCGPICVDFLKSNNFLAPGKKMTLKFTRASNEFLFLTNTAGEYKLEIKALAIYGRRIKVDPSIIRSILRPMSPQQYIVPFTEVKEYALPAGIRSWNTKIYSSHTLPSHIIVAQVATAAAVGSKSRNPFNFQHFDLNLINLRLNGIRVPNEPLEPDFENELIMRSYLHMFMNSGKYRMDDGNCISEEQFKDGSTIFPFDLTPDQCLNFHKHRSVSGVLELEIAWAQPLPEGVTVLIHASSEQVILLGEDSVQPQVTII